MSAVENKVMDKCGRPLGLNLHIYAQYLGIDTR